MVYSTGIRQISYVKSDPTNMNNRKRDEPEANYSAVFFNGRTLRSPIDPSKPITELRFPEFYDLSPGN